MFNRVIAAIAFLLIAVGVWQYVYLQQPQGIALMGMGNYALAASEDNSTIKWLIWIMGTLYIVCGLILTRIQENNELLLQILNSTKG